MTDTGHRIWSYGSSVRAPHNLNVQLLLEQRRHLCAGATLTHQGEHPIQDFRSLVAIFGVIAMKGEPMSSRVSTFLYSPRRFQW